jgi:chromate transporter
VQSLLRHIPFLQAVFKYACTAFGGPTAHIGAITNIFVQHRKDITQQELTEIFSFCQLLPGPSSTQTITLIGYKRGGVRLAVITLLIWILPACIIMCLLGLLVHYINLKNLSTTVFSLVPFMALGFLLYAALQASTQVAKHIATFGIMLVACITTVLIRSPWVFPILLIIGSIVSNLSSKRIPAVAKPSKPIQWHNLWLMLLLFALAGIVSELARIQRWQYFQVFNLFENFYRFGSLVWGGGHALMPVLYEQFIELPKLRGTTPMLSGQELLTGFGLVNAIPGPVFSISSFVGAMALKQYGWYVQVGGSIVSVIAMFLPSTLLVLFFYPVYNLLKQQTIIYRALEGITAVIIGTMWASGINIAKSLHWQIIPILVLIGVALLLKFTKIPAPIIVIATLIIGSLYGLGA